MELELFWRASRHRGGWGSVGRSLLDLAAGRKRARQAKGRGVISQREHAAKLRSVVGETPASASAS